MMTLLDAAMVNFPLGYIAGCIRIAGIAGTTPGEVHQLFFERLNASSFVGKCAMRCSGSTFSKKTLNPSVGPRHQCLSRPPSPNSTDFKERSPISGRCCAPHPPCIDLIDPPGHPL